MAPTSNGKWVCLEVRILDCARGAYAYLSGGVVIVAECRRKYLQVGQNRVRADPALAARCQNWRKFALNKIALHRARSDFEKMGGFFNAQLRLLEQ